MTDLNRVMALTRAIVYQERRRQGWKLLAVPIGASLLFLLVIVGATSQGILTPATQRALEASIEEYFIELEGSAAFALGLLLVQGPYLLALFASLVALWVVRPLVSVRVLNGEFELLMSAPYEDREVFLALLLAALTLVLFGLIVLSVVGLGGSGLYILLTGAEFELRVGGAIYAAFLLPLPIALWATLTAVMMYIRYPTISFSGMGPGRYAALVPLAPGLGAVFGITAFPSISPVIFALGLFAITLIGIVIGTVTISRWFHPDKLV